MKNSQFTRVISLFIIFIMAFSLFACSSESPDKGSAVTTAATETDAGSEETTAEVDTRFLGVDYKGREFRVYTSVDASDATNANSFIEGVGELTGDIVDDAVYERNMLVEELLGIKLKFVQSNFTYDTATTGIRTYVMAGADEFDVIINDLRSMAALGIEGMFHEVSDVDNFDYSKAYWYNDYMQDLEIIPGHYYLMAGDYFMDVIASCHALFYNKQIAENYFGDPNHIYNLVLDGQWTYDKMNEVVANVYSDMNGDGTVNEGDLFGLSLHGTWGSAIPFIGSSGMTFIDRSSGYPEFAFNNERSISYMDKLNALWHNTGTLSNIVDSSDFNAGLRKLFSESKTLIVGYQRLGDLVKMRDIEFDIGVIPYPKFSVDDQYITSTHDTTEVGVIPITTTDMEFVTTVLEVLNRETEALVIPQYYETALKVKYTTDTISATMIDIVHDSFGSTFPLAYSDSLTQILLQSFSDNLPNNVNNFASVYAGKEKSATTQLQKMIDTSLANISQ
jgi:ABC-type sugar transport system, periplasmic component